MKKFFTLILAILLIGTLFTGCSQYDDNRVSINITIKKFATIEDRQKYAENLDTTKYQIIGENYNNYMISTHCDLILIEKANNENYEVFEFSNKTTRKEFREKLDNSKKVDYFESNNFYYLIVVTENTAKKSTITVKEILQNEENYIVIADDDSLVMVPKNISEFVTSSEDNTVYLETTAGTITKATFCITEEMQNTIQ